MTVLPYVTVSIVSSLGRLDYATAKALAARVGAVMLCRVGRRPDRHLPDAAGVPGG